MSAYAMGHDFPNYIEHNLTTLDRNAAGQLSSQTISNDAYAWTGHRAVQRTQDGAPDARRGRC